MASRQGAIVALVELGTVEGAARKVGIARTTLYRWLEDPAFKEQYMTARRQVLDGAVTNLVNATGEAVDTLRRNLTCGRPYAEIQAAQAILANALKAIEITDLDARLEALERRAEEIEQNGE